MKAKLIFDVPEERSQFLAAAKANDMAMALWEIVYNLRKRAEDYFDTAEAKDASEVIDFIFTNINNELNHHEINIDDLME